MRIFFAQLAFVALPLFFGIEGRTTSTHADAPPSVMRPFSALKSVQSTHLERLKLLQLVAAEYQSASTEKRQELPSFYKTVFEALIQKDEGATLDLAYSFKGLNGAVAAAPIVALDLLAPFGHTDKAKALKTFLRKRSVANAQAFLAVADTPRSKAVASMCMAEAAYASKDTAKAIMYATLSLAYDFTDEREAQAKFYLTGENASPLSLKLQKEELIEHLLAEMKDTMSPQQFQRYYDMVSVLGLLPEFPYSKELLEKKPTDPIQICIGFDSKYSIHAGVTMLSAMLSANPNTRYVFHVPEDPDSANPISESQKKRLKSLMYVGGKDRFEIVFETFDLDLIDNKLFAVDRKGHWPRSIFFKLYIPTFYSSFDRFMWLDSDLLVRSDLGDFYRQNFKGKWLVGVRDLDAEKHSARLGMDKESGFLNAGVLLFNNKVLKNNMGVLHKYIEKMNDIPEPYRCPEQDAIALAFNGHILEKGQQVYPSKYFHHDGEWNFFYFRHPSTSWPEVHTHYSKVIHMATRGGKPWNRRWSSFFWNFSPKTNDGVANLYWALRDMGPWPTRAS